MASDVTRDRIVTELAANGRQFIRETEDGYSLYGDPDDENQNFPIHWETVNLEDMHETLKGIGYICPNSHDS